MADNSSQRSSSSDASSDYDWLPRSLPIPPRLVIVRDSVQILADFWEPSEETPPDSSKFNPRTPGIRLLRYAPATSPFIASRVIREHRFWSLWDDINEDLTGQQRQSIYEDAIPDMVTVKDGYLDSPFFYTNPWTRFEVASFLKKRRHVRYEFDRPMYIQFWLDGMPRGALEEVNHFTISCAHDITIDKNLWEATVCSHLSRKFPSVTVKNDTYQFDVEFQDTCCLERYVLNTMSACGKMLPKLQRVLGSRRLVHHADGDLQSFVTREVGYPFSLPYSTRLLTEQATE